MSNYPLPPVATPQPHFLVDVNGNPFTSANPAPVSQIVGSGPITATNPEINISNIQQLIINGQGFSATTGKQTSGGAFNVAACIFSPATQTTKNLLFYSVQVFTGGSAPVVNMSLVTTDPVLASVMTYANLKLGSATTSAVSATLEYQNVTSGAPPGTVIASPGGAANALMELLTNGEIIYIPNSTAGGVYVSVPTSTSVWAVTFRWVEF